MTKKESFKAVEFMRKRRDELSELHEKDQAEYQRQLEQVRKKFDALFKRSGKKAA